MYGSDDKLAKIAPDGNASVVTTSLVRPSGIAFDTHDQIYVADSYANSISTLTSTGQARTFAGGCCNSNLAAFDQSNNFYIANNNKSGTIRKVTPDGRMSEFLSGVGSFSGMAFDRSGTLYVSDSSANTISKLTPDGRTSVFVASGLDGPDLSLLTAAATLCGEPHKRQQDHARWPPQRIREQRRQSPIRLGIRSRWQPLYRWFLPELDQGVSEGRNDRASRPIQKSHTYCI